MRIVSVKMGFDETGEMEAIKFITSQLDEAVREAEKQARCWCWDHAFEKGFAAAREKAAGIFGIHEGCTEEICIDRKIIAERIRAMEVDR